MKFLEKPNYKFIIILFPTFYINFKISGLGLGLGLGPTQTPTQTPTPTPTPNYIKYIWDK